jgi:hypothetical protein
LKFNGLIKLSLSDIFNKFHSKMLKTNKDQLVKIALGGKVASAFEWLPFEIAHDGNLHAVPSTGGITLNVRVGDKALGWRGDHIEPAVSSICIDSEKKAGNGYNFLSCLGNEVLITSGDAKGEKGFVVGKHGGVEHVMLDFPNEVLEKLTPEDKFLIKSFGQGLILSDYPEIKVYNLDPWVLEEMPISQQNGKLQVQVKSIIPAGLMGSGIGQLGTTRGDYDILTQDENEVKKHGIDALHLGDLVAIENADNTIGRTWRFGSMTIGIVIHCDSYLAGHGPGVMTLLTCATDQIEAVIGEKVNFTDWL